MSSNLLNADKGNLKNLPLDEGQTNIHSGNEQSDELSIEDEVSIEDDGYIVEQNIEDEYNKSMETTG